MFVIPVVCVIVCVWCVVAVGLQHVVLPYSEELCLPAPANSHLPSASASTAATAGRRALTVELPHWPGLGWAPGVPSGVNHFLTQPRQSQVRPSVVYIHVHYRGCGVSWGQGSLMAPLGGQRKAAKSRRHDLIVITHSPKISFLESGMATKFCFRQFYYLPVRRVNRNSRFKSSCYTNDIRFNTSKRTAPCLQITTNRRENTSDLWRKEHLSLPRWCWMLAWVLARMLAWMLGFFATCS